MRPSLPLSPSPLLLVLLFSVSCAAPTASLRYSEKPRSGSASEPGSFAARLDKAERSAPPGGARVLAEGRKMALVTRDILPGSCWDWINTAFNRAGYSEKKRVKIYKTKKSGPYADSSLIRAGDWLYYVNHSYGEIEHSGIFVDWVDRGTKQAMILSYPGEKRKEPGRYSPYDLSNVYAITRAGE